MLKPSLQLKLSQQLTMTPQLQQAIRLLQLPIMDLQNQIQDALEQNVMLEAEDPGASTIIEAPSFEDTEGATPTPEVEAINEATWADRQTAAVGDRAHAGTDFRGQQDYRDTSEETLADHLLWQLELEHVDDRTAAIGQAIVDAINDDGYLVDDLDTIQETLRPDVEAPIDEIEVILEMIQRLDPAGVGARSVSECVLLQLRQLDPNTESLELAKTIATEYLDLVADHQYAALKRRLQASDDELNTALLLVRGCHPRPGASINAPAADYVVPDVYVRKVDGDWVVELNGSISPKIRVNQTYAGSLGRTGEYDTLRAQLQEARWLIRSLEIRNETLFKVATSIVARQQAFLEHGELHMKPLVLRDIAEAVEMHESTISRVTTNKYMHTPRGIFEFRYFFSSHVGGDSGDEQSSIAVRAMIKRLVADENPAKPLSDSQIAKLLAADGVKVARRTVAKYREGMQISSSSERRKAYAATTN